jgi:broad specificity phosphatase PhoE
MMPSHGATHESAPPPRVERVLYFVRHGQYSAPAGAKGGVLTALGRRQAARLRLYFEGLPVDSVSSSDLPRAVQTAEALARDLGVARVRRHAMLREVLPVAVHGVRVPLDKRARGKDQLDEIVARWFQPTRRARHEVIVCHGNLIRCLVCRVLRAPLTSFGDMLVYHAGVTRFTVDVEGVQLCGFNEIQHVPARFRSSR